MSCIDATRSLASISDLLRRIPALSTLLAIVAAFLPLSLARAQTFSNNAPIPIPAFGPATPYPSTINVTGRAGPTEGIRVTLNNFNHTFPNDVVVLLVSPTGQKVLLMGRVGGTAPVSNITATFSSDSSTLIPDILVSGTYAPTGTTPAVAPPAPAAPYSSNLADLTGQPSNGVWQLFVEDRASGDNGTIAFGWSIEFVDRPFPAISSNGFTYQGRLTGADAGADLRFALWDNPFSQDPDRRLSDPITRTNVALAEGIFTVDLDFGFPIPAEVGAFLEIEVSSPPGSPYVTLTPRQAILPAPVAGTLTPMTTLPPVAEIRGPQSSGSTGSLVIRAAGADLGDETGSQGGTLRLLAGNANLSAGSAPPVGTSANNNIEIIAGDNLFPAAFGSAFNGNIQFFAGDFKPERMRIVGDNGFVGIGTTNPTQRLDVRGSIALGANGEYRAAAGDENLRMLRGTVNSNGTVSAGVGFTATRTGVGIYTVNFTTLFSAFPVVTANALNASPVYIHISTVAGNTVTFNVRNSTGVLTDSVFNFIAIGPR